MGKLKPSKEELAKWSRLQERNKEGKDGMSWQELADTFGKKYGLECKNDMRNEIIRYRKKVSDR